MIVWAEENKIRSKRTDDYEIPQRNGVDWKFDLKFVTKLDFMLGDGKDLTSKELQMCNQLYNFYSKTYIKNLLRK